MILDHFYGVPTAASTNKRWIDNYGELKVISCRFGGEGAGGWPIVYNFAAPEQVYPYNLGGMVSIRDSFCSIGPSGAGNRAIVYLATDLPQIIDLQGNYGLTHDAANYIVDGIGGGLTAYLAGINSNVRFYVHIKNNAGWVPLDISGIPASLSGASPLQVHFDVEGSLLPWAVEFDAATSAKTDSNWPGANIAFGGHYEGYFRYSSGAQNASISFQAVLTAGTWSAVLAHTQDSDRGIYTVEVNGASVGTIDGYAAGTTEAVGSVGAIAVTDTGLYSIQLVMATKNVASSNYRGAISHLSMVRTA